MIRCKWWAWQKYRKIRCLQWDSLVSAPPLPTGTLGVWLRMRIHASKTPSLASACIAVGSGVAACQEILRWHIWRWLCTGGSGPVSTIGTHANKLPAQHVWENIENLDKMLVSVTNAKLVTIVTALVTAQHLCKHDHCAQCMPRHIFAPVFCRQCGRCRRCLVWEQR